MAWRAAFLIGIIVAVAALWPESDRWTATIYNTVTLDSHEYVGAFRTLEECRANAAAAMSHTDWGVAGAYECALNCEPWGNPAHDLLECEVIAD